LPKRILSLKASKDDSRKYTFIHLLELFLIECPIYSCDSLLKLLLISNAGKLMHMCYGAVIYINAGYQYHSCPKIGVPFMFLYDIIESL
jgi:hypothetical protein